MDFAGEDLLVPTQIAVSTPRPLVAADHAHGIAATSLSSQPTRDERWGPKRTRFGNWPDLAIKSEHPATQLGRSLDPVGYKKCLTPTRRHSYGQACDLCVKNLKPLTGIRDDQWGDEIASA